MTSLAELLAEETEDDVLTFFLTQLASKGWPVTDWSPTGAGRALLQVFARGLSQLSASVAAIARGGYLDSSAGAWLDLLSSGFYGIARQSAVFAVAKVRLTRTSGGAATYTAGQLWIRTADGRLYNQTAGGTLSGTVGSTLDLEFKASSAGIASNLTIGTPVSFVTPPVGVTVALVETSSGSGSCMAVSGVNEESDAALRERCRTRWASLGAEKTKDAYVYLARNALDGAGDPVLGVTKVLVDDSNPRGPGTVDVYLADDAGPCSPAIVASVDDYLQPRKGLCADLQTLPAVGSPIYVVGTVTVKAAYLTTAKSEIRAALQQYQADLQIADGDSGTYEDRAIKAELIRLLKSPSGVVNVALTSPATEPELSLGEIASLQYSLDGGGATISFVVI